MGKRRYRAAAKSGRDLKSYGAEVVRQLLHGSNSLLDSVQDYLYGEGQKVRTSEERDAFTLALAICGACRRGETDPVAAATYSAFGSTLDRYLKYRAQKQWIQHQELLRCIPDYDPQEDNRVRREFQPVASPIISWPIPETVSEASRDKPPSRGAVGSKPATDSRKFAEVSARTARTRKRGLGAG